MLSLAGGCDEKDIGLMAVGHGRFSWVIRLHNDAGVQLCVRECARVFAQSIQMTHKTPWLSVVFLSWSWQASGSGRSGVRVSREPLFFVRGIFHEYRYRHPHS